MERLFSATSEPIAGTKFADGNGDDGKHYWLTPPELMASLQAEFGFDCDACPFPLPEGFDGLTDPWGESTYVNPPFGSIMHNGRKKGPTAWVRKAIAEASQGKRVVLVYPIDKWILMLLATGAEVRNLGDVKWCATEDGTPGKGTGRHIACFVLGERRGDDAARFRKLMDLATYGGTYKGEHVWRFRPIMGPHENLLDAIDAMGE